MVLAMLAMVVTSFLRKLQATTISAPNWIVTTVTFISNNRAGRFFLLDKSKTKTPKTEENSEEINEPEVNVAETKNRDDSWRKLAIIIEWLAFVITIFVYVVLIVLLVPMSNSKPRMSV
jgi:hypothetical protein